MGIDFVTPALATTSNVGGWEMAAWDPNFKAQRAQEWNLTVERVLPGNFAASLAYVGNHGGNLPDYDPVNASLPRSLMPNPPAGGFSGLPYPIYQPGTLGSMDKFEFVGYSNHNEGRAEIKHTFRGSFLLQSYFTYGRSLGTSEGQLDAMTALELQPATLTNNASMVQRLRAIYAPDSYMPEKTFVANGHYELPFGRGKQFLSKSGGFVNEAVSGWNGSLFYSRRTTAPILALVAVTPPTATCTFWRRARPIAAFCPKAHVRQRIGSMTAYGIPPRATHMLGKHSRNVITRVTRTC